MVTLSSYVKVENIVKGDRTGEAGAILKIKCYDENDEVLIDRNSVGVTSEWAGNEWQRISVNSTIPTNTSYFRIYFGLRNATGTAWFDCMQLEEDSVMNDYNALANSDFKSTDSWTYNLEGETNDITLTDGKVQLTGNGGEPAQIEETEAEESEATVATYTSEVTETFENDYVESIDAYGNVTQTQQGFVTRTYKATLKKLLIDRASYKYPIPTTSGVMLST